MAEELAKMKPQVYKDPRPAEYFDQLLRAPATRRPDWMYEVVRPTTLPAFVFRARCIDSDKIPPRRARDHRAESLLVPDHFFVAACCAARSTWAKSQPFLKRPLQFIYSTAESSPCGAATAT